MSTQRKGAKGRETKDVAHSLHRLEEVVQCALGVVPPLRERELLENVQALEDLRAVVRGRGRADGVSTVGGGDRLEPARLVPGEVRGGDQAIVLFHERHHLPSNRALVERIHSTGGQLLVAVGEKVILMTPPVYPY